MIEETTLTAQISLNGHPLDAIGTARVKAAISTVDFTFAGRQGDYLQFVRAAGKYVDPEETRLRVAEALKRIEDLTEVFGITLVYTNDTDVTNRLTTSATTL